MNKRFQLGATILIAAIALGAGVGVYRWNAAGKADPTSERAIVSSFFSSAFTDSFGQQQAVKQWQDRVLVVNFWATWCAPCVEEMPELQLLRDRYAAQNVEVIGLAIDNAAAVADFQRDFKIRYPLLIANASGSDLSREFGNSAVALPFTVLLDRQGTVRYRKLGRIRVQELQQQVDSALQQTAPGRSQ